MLSLENQTQKTTYYVISCLWSKWKSNSVETDAEQMVDSRD